MNEVKIKGLDEKAVLVQLKRRMYSPNLLDAEATEDYAVGNVNKHLFEGRNNRVKEAMSKYTEVYTFVKDNTVPWSKGIDMLNILHYYEFSQGLRERIEVANQAVDDLVANWDSEVRKDLLRIQAKCAAKGIPDKSNPADYPTAQQVADRFGVEVRYLPVPTAGDFRVAISEEDKASLQKQLDDAEKNAASHVLTSMLDPMRKAVEKLSVEIGKEGAIFRDSLIDNMVEVAERMTRVNISDDPRVQERINDLRSLLGTYANNKDMLRTSQVVREKAASQLDELMNKMAGLV
jgi:hypothetical protein